MVDYPTKLSSWGGGSIFATWTLTRGVKLCKAGKLKKQESLGFLEIPLLIAE